MTKDNENKTSEEERISRRRFIKSSGVAVGGLAVGGVIGGLIPWRTEDNKQQRQAANETKTITKP